MVAYSFKDRFELPIQQGWKTQTIRAMGRRRHARRGDLLQLYVGMRTAQCRLILPELRCTDVMKCVISFDGDGAIERVVTDGVAVRDLDDFARRDGFEHIDDMSDFWRREHGPMGLWHGVVIEWAPPARQPEGRA